MANSIERLFEQVMSRAASTAPPNWPRDVDPVFDEEDVDPIWKSDPDREAVLHPIDEAEQLNRTFDRLAEERVLSPISPEERDLFDGGLRHRGTEALAFYKSRRYMTRAPFPGHWGIFYLREGLAYVEAEIRSAYPGFGNPRTLALEFLRAHERFHYMADVQSLLFEAVLGRQLYEPIRVALRGRSSHFVEEALANRQAWDWAKRQEVGLGEFAFDFMKLQPNAYTRFDENRLDLASEWAAIIVDQQLPFRSPRDDLAAWVETVPKNYLRRSLCPEYVIAPGILSAWVSPALVIPPVTRIRETQGVIKLLSGRYAELAAEWDNTKAKLILEARLPGLNFKPFPKAEKGAWSVRVNKGDRAHLRPVGSGAWEAFEIGDHKSLGHG